jgi:hypothetical protein
MLIPSLDLNASMPEHVIGKRDGPIWNQIFLINCKVQMPFYTNPVGRRTFPQILSTPKQKFDVISVMSVMLSI